ncbi:DUF3866 family protein [Fodinisporobacter ferrooxydans]|uniref:DUF3866 family protein n=1 Tax=Fodinisporobacter ferrooxydans TaxID=2901836 RepID=A0ABY4CHK8_9BACL|nr:DUF3866 family protein [Alicyclobacillaceae bacterium MYW30-H2]
MIDWESGYVIGIREEREHIQLIDVIEESSGSIQPAIAYPLLTGSCALGMRVRINRTARMLGLGSGGYDFVIPDADIRETLAKPENPEFGTELWLDAKGSPLSACAENQKTGTDRSHFAMKRQAGHIMKLRYTPMQLKVHAIEEPTHPLHSRIYGKDSLHNCPVIVAELHSMVPVLCSVLQYLTSHSCQIAYVMTDGGALPAMMSKNCQELKQKHLLAGVVTVGNAFGGDIEAINLYSGLLAARYALQADAIIVAMGPGITGSGTTYGHTGIEQGVALNAIHTLRGHGIPVLRCSATDRRKRHDGISHHTLTSLMQVSLVSGSIGVPEIASSTVKEKIWDQLIGHRICERYEIIETGCSHVSDAFRQYGIHCSSMGRTYEDDPVFFDMAGAAAEVAVRSTAWRKSLRYAEDVRN